MKKTVLILAAAGLIFMTPSCLKKGENDPFLSLSSRNARITGTWELSSLSSENVITTVNSGTTQIDKETLSYDGNIMTETWTNGGGGTATYSYTMELSIEKDGTYKMTTVVDGETSEVEGHWWWLTDKKRKTRIAFDDDVDSFEIDQLKSKEMVLTLDVRYKDTYTNGDSDEEIRTYSATYSKK